MNKKFILVATTIIWLQLFNFLSQSLPDSTFIGSVLTKLPAKAETNFPAQKTLKIGSKQYKPPVDRNPRRSYGSGSRGEGESRLQVSLLIPSQEYVAQTTSGHPTFFWYFSKPVSVPVRFTLIESGIPKPLIEKQLEETKAGINQLEMPKDLPALQPGHLYRWSVTLVENQLRPSRNPNFSGWIQRVPATADLQQKLADATSDRDRAQIYAQAGQWYDALAAISAALTAHPSNTSIRENFQALLDQVGLTQVAENELQQMSKQ